MNIWFNEFEQDPPCGFLTTYTISMASGSVPSFISLDFSLRPMAVKIYSVDNNFAGTYTIKISARLTNSDSSTTNGILLIPLKLDPLNYGVPYFV